MFENLKKIQFLFILFFFLSVPSIVNARLVNCKGDDGCNLSDFEPMIVNAANMILGVSGAITLLFFIYGGVVLLTSAGASDRVTQGRTILTNSIIGLLVIFSSFVIIQFVVGTLGGKAEPKTLKINIPPSTP